MRHRLRLAGLFIFFLLIPPIGYGIVSAKTATLDSVSLDSIYYRGGEYYFNFTVKIDNPSLIPLKLQVELKSLTVNNASIKITGITLSKTVIPGRNKTIIHLTVAGEPIGGIREEGYILVKARSNVCIRFSIEPSLLGFPGSVQCSYTETSNVIGIGD